MTEKRFASNPTLNVVLDAVLAGPELCSDVVLDAVLAGPELCPGVPLHCPGGFQHCTGPLLTPWSTFNTSPALTLKGFTFSTTCAFSTFVYNKQMPKRLKSKGRHFQMHFDLFRQKKRRDFQIRFDHIFPVSSNLHSVCFSPP
jgi:hypothetical protein